jgi:hypothetical protein
VWREDYTAFSERGNRIFSVHHCANQRYWRDLSPLLAARGFAQFRLLPKAINGYL